MNLAIVSWYSSHQFSKAKSTQLLTQDDDTQHPKLSVPECIPNFYTLLTIVQKLIVLDTTVIKRACCRGLRLWSVNVLDFYRHRKSTSSIFDRQAFNKFLAIVICWLRSLK